MMVCKVGIREVELVSGALPRSVLHLLLFMACWLFGVLEEQGDMCIMNRFPVSLCIMFVLRIAEFNTLLNTGGRVFCQPQRAFPLERSCLQPSESLAG